MTPQDFKTLRVESGHGQADLAARWKITTRTVRRLETEPEWLEKMPYYADALRHVVTTPKADPAPNLR